MIHPAIYEFLKPTVFSMVLFLMACGTPGVTQDEKPCMKSPEDELMRFSRADLEDSSCFSWFRPAYTEYKPDNAAIEKLKQYRKSLAVTAFAGSWCDDSRTLLPRFYKVMETAGVPSKNITLVPVSRQKKSSDGTAEAMKVEEVPIFIFYHKGKEIGRIVETAPEPIEEMVAEMLEKR